jgi:SPP1 gp7 family putative phage head morphogenesis protein
MSKSSDYWRRREEEWLAQNRKSEKAQADEVQAIYDYMLDEIEKEINSFFERYAYKEGISMAEAKKRADTIDIEAYMRKAAKYVKEKDFSDQANKEMRLYNMTMKVNRLELLKSSIGLDLVAGHDELKTYMGEKLTDHVVETLRHNAAILGPTIMNDADRKAKAIVNSSFHNATFSDRIWQHQDKLRNEMTNILTTALIGGRNPREFVPKLRKRFDVSARDAERLLRTEQARVQIEAQKESYKDENIEEYEYIACGLADCCDICRALDGKHFKVSKMVVGENAPPMHPNCHCSTGPYLDRKEYDEWLDSYKEHHMSYSDWIKMHGDSKSGDSLESDFKKFKRGQKFPIPRKL